MSNWERLDRNVRKELNLEPDPKKLELALKAFVHKANCNPIQIQIFSQTSLFSFRRILEMKPITELNDISEVVLEAKAKTIFKMVKQKETRGGKRAVTEKKMRDLTTILYGDSMARQREGTWTPEANCLHCTGIRTRAAPDTLLCRAVPFNSHCGRLHGKEQARAEGLLPDARGRLQGSRQPGLRGQPEALPVPVHPQQEALGVQDGLACDC